MSGRARLALLAGAIFVPVALAPLLLTPKLAIVFAAGVVALALAARSVAYPVALVGIPSVVIGLSGGANPLPTGVVTIAMFAWVFLAIGIAVLRSQDELPLQVLFTPSVLLTVLLAVWLVARLGSSLDPSYGSRKLQLFLAQNVVLLLAGVLIGRHRGRLDLWVVVALGMAVVSSLVLTHQLLIGQTTGGVAGRLSLTQADNPILLGRDAARGLLLAVFLLLASRVAWLRMVALCSIPVIAISFMAAGSRGPVVGLLAGLLVLVGITARDAASRRRIQLVFVAAMAAVALVPQLVPGGDIGRTLSIVSGTSEGLSSNGRSHLWSVAWSLFTAHPFTGIGTGSFAAYGGGVVQYPHNILLEAAVELGVVGLLLVGGLLAVSIVQAGRIVRVADGVDRNHAALLAALLVSAVVNAMLSGDITVNSTVWLSAGLVAGLGRRTGTLLRSVDPIALVRQRPATKRPAVRPPSHEPRGRGETAFPGRIVSPEGGSVVGGLVAVVVEPARLLRALDSVRLEWRDGDEWREAARLDERTYDLVVEGEPAAVVRSEELARSLAEALDGRFAASPRRPWGAAVPRRLLWDSSPHDGATLAIRAVTRGVDGTEAETAPVRLRVDQAAGSTTRRSPRFDRFIPPGVAAEIERREKSTAVEEARLKVLAGEVRAARAAVEQRERELRAVEHELDRSSRESQRRAADDAERHERLRAARAEVEQREAALGARESELERARRDLERGHKKLRAALSDLEKRKKALAKRSAELEQALVAVDRREAAAAAREVELKRAGGGGTTSRRGRGA